MSQPSDLDFRTRSEWRSWLEENHTREKGIWLTLYKKGSKLEGLRYDEAVEEAICFGWIDGKMQSVDDDKFRQWFSPRRGNSVWSKLNRRRAERMMEARLMAEAGYAEVEKAEANGRWESAYTSRVAPEVPDDLIEALRGDEEAWGNWEAFSNSVKLMYTRWVQDAKREETRARRISEVVRRTTQNIRPS
ncbi:YdeI/OmpD-associated family protein [Candidatus Bathyarchaeota archaeon]|nr:YdeI/OmpD-associated family protein [Candidatus Bathyarchaeota archaeon]